MIGLGTRWAFGAQPPARLSAEVAQAIAEAERDLRDSGRSDLDGAMWTLTWLEGRPIAELDRDDQGGEPVVVSVDSTGRIVGSASPGDDDSDDDSW